MERVRRHVSYANVAATLALVFAMSGVGYAASGGFTSGGKLQACVNGEGTLKLLKPGKRCAKGQQAVAWNQIGPAGAPGAAGATGAAGAVGAVGATGTVGATGAAGAAGTAGKNGAAAPGTTKWASVDINGNMIAGQGVTATKISGNSTVVDFEGDVTKCALFATSQTATDGVSVSSARLFSGSTTRVNVQAASGSGLQVVTGLSVQAVCP